VGGGGMEGSKEKTNAKTIQIILFFLEQLKDESQSLRVEEQ
jgi:hypothetical protein